MTMRVYRWDDSSAPTLSASNGALITVLDAVLVNGYGSKTAAGWTKAFSGTNLAAYLQGSGSNGRYLRVDNSTSDNFPRLRGFKAMSAISTGTDGFPLDAQVSGGLYGVTSSTNDSTARPWIILADPKRFYMWIGHNVSTATGTTTTTQEPTLFFGDFISHVASDAYNTLLIAAPSANVNFVNFGSQTQNMYTAISGHYICGSYAQVTGSIQVGKMANGHLTGAIAIGTTSYTYADTASGGMLLYRVYIVESSSTIRGYLPGFWAPAHNLPGSPGDTFSGSSSGNMSGKTFILLDINSSATRGRGAFETSDTWS